MPPWQRKRRRGRAFFGGLALNAQVGGLNVDAVAVALKMGARIIWMPTFSADNHLRARGGGPGIRVVSDGVLAPAIPAILDLIRQDDAILHTGHLAVAETVALVKAAREMGVRKIVVTHPELWFITMPAAVQQELAEMGAYFERCFCSTTEEGRYVPLASMAGDIRRVGMASTILATDFGQVGNPLPVPGMRQYAAAMLDAGFTWQEVLRMGRDNPARLLGLA